MRLHILNDPIFIFSLLAAIAVDHHCSYTANGGVRHRFQREPEMTMEDYAMIRDLSKWAGGVLSSDIIYSLYIDEDGRQLKASDAVGNLKTSFKWIVPQSILLTTLRRMKNEDEALLNGDSYAGLRETRKRKIKMNETQPAYLLEIRLTPIVNHGTIPP